MSSASVSFDFLSVLSDFVSSAFSVFSAEETSCVSSGCVVLSSSLVFEQDAKTAVIKARLRIRQQILLKFIFLPITKFEPNKIRPFKNFNTANYTYFGLRVNTTVFDYVNI